MRTMNSLVVVESPNKTKKTYHSPGLFSDNEMNQQAMSIHVTNLLDEHTFEQVFDKHYDGMFRYCNTMIRDAAEAEDIVQSAFVDLWQDRQKLNIHTSIQAFLYKSVYFKCMNKIKHDKVEQKYRNSRVHDLRTSSGDLMIQKEIIQIIHQAIQLLPEQCRKIFTMSRDEGLRYHEIADKLQLSPKTVENQMGKALKTMRLALSEFIHFTIFIILSHMI